jgi:23S rRNA pseudouridine1911/1915/1917 synthase
MEVPRALDGERLDRVVSTLLDLSRQQAADLVADGRVSVEGLPVTHRSRRVREGEVVEVEREQAAPRGPLPEEDVRFEVVHCDEHVIVVDKPPGLVVHPGAGHPGGTLVNGLLARFPELADVGDPARPGIVHRLDAGTSGLLVVARTPRAYTSLVAQMAARSVERLYLALCWGRFDETAGVVDAPVGRSATRRTSMGVVATGRSARTAFEVVSQFRRPAEVTLLRCRLETGRTHQVRVHLAAIGHPVVGDARYGGRRSPIPCPRPFLHAHRLAFDHPASTRRMSFEAELPADLREVHDLLV